MTEGFPEFDKGPFVRKHLDTATDVIPVRFNPEQREKLKAMKDVWRSDADSTVLKWCLEFVHNVVFARPQEALWRQIASQRRLRPGPK